MVTAESLVNNGIARPEYPAEVRSAVRKVAEAWPEFTALPLSLKKEFVYEHDAGYERKEVRGATLDLKENFQITLREFERLELTAKKTKKPEALRFVIEGYNLLAALEPFVAEFAIAVQKEFGLIGFVDEVFAGHEDWTLRCLRYFGDRKPGEIIGAMHADQSGFTPHLYQSDTGLEYFDLYSREWRPMLFTENRTAITPNVQLQYRTEGRVKALYHRVVATEKSARGGRYSMVCFIPLVHTPKWDKVKHGRLQDRPLAFNYDMPFDEYSKFFS